MIIVLGEQPDFRILWSFEQLFLFKLSEQCVVCVILFWTRCTLMLIYTKETCKCVAARQKGRWKVQGGWHLIMLCSKLQNFYKIITHSQFSIIDCQNVWFSTGMLMVGVVLLSRRMKINPDNVATPIAASLGDLTTLAMLAGVGAVLYSAIGEALSSVLAVHVNSILACVS